MIKEIEIKVRCSDNILGAVESKISSSLRHYSGSDEEDVYYTSIYKDFIKSEECLRIRTINGQSELTWKPPTTAEMKEAGQYWKEEINIDINTQRESLKRMMMMLGFVEYVTVTKHRNTYIYDDESKVVVDSIEMVGTFLEVETMCEDESYGVRKNAAILREIVGDYKLEIINEPHRDIVKRET